MNDLYVSPDFTIEDIHRIREYNYEITKDMTFEERKKYYEKNSENGLKRIQELRKKRKHNN